MKKIVFTFFIILVSQLAIAQESAAIPSQEKIYNPSEVEVQPEFNGGLEQLSIYLQKNYKLPNVKSLKGRVFVEFIIESDGSIGEVKMLRDLGFGTGDEAVRVIKNSPKWKPGVYYGKPVRVRYSMPIAIDIH